MASILNVRDVNNNVVHIPAIRGEKGDPTDLTVVPSKGSVVDGDGFLIADSADSKSSKLLLWSTIKAIFASRIVPAAAGNLATLDASGNLADSGKLPAYFQQATNGLTAETTLDDADVIPFYDASATAHRKSTWANLKEKIKSALFGSVSGIPKLDGSGTVSAADAAALKTLLDTLTAVIPATGDKIPLTDISGNIAGYSTIANIRTLVTPSIYSGTTEPSGSTGVDGDFYFKTK